MDNNKPQQQVPSRLTNVAPGYACYSPLSATGFLQHFFRPKNNRSLRAFTAFDTMHSNISEISTHLPTPILVQKSKPKLRHSNSISFATRDSIQDPFEYSATASLDKMPTQGMLYRWEDNAVGKASANSLRRYLTSHPNRVSTTSVPSARPSCQAQGRRRRVSANTKRCVPSTTRPCS